MRYTFLAFVLIGLPASTCCSQQAQVQPGIDHETAEVKALKRWLAMAESTHQSVHAAFAAGASGGEPEKEALARHQMCIAKARLAEAKGDSSKAEQWYAAAVDAAEAGAKAAQTAYAHGTCLLETLVHLQQLEAEAKIALSQARHRVATQGVGSNVGEGQSDWVSFNDAPLSSEDVECPRTIDVPPPDLEYDPARVGEDVKTLITRALDANRPWIAPQPLQAAYSLVLENAETTRRVGPFSVQKNSKRALRVGSILWTPLHAMTRKQTPFKARLVGMADWNGKRLVAVDVAFDPPIRCGIGFGGQEDTTYASCEFVANTARIVFDSTRAIPLVIDCRSDASGHAERVGTWAFDADYFSLDGAFAPKETFWERTAVGGFLERQQFQIVDGSWIFKRGDAWNSPASSFDDPRHMQRVRLVDLQIAKK